MHKETKELTLQALNNRKGQQSALCAIFGSLNCLSGIRKKIRPYIGVETYLIYLLLQSPRTHFLRSMVVKTISLSVLPSIGFRSKTFSKLSVIAFSAAIGLEKLVVAAAAGSEGLIVATAARSEGLMVAAAAGLRRLMVPAATAATGLWGSVVVAALRWSGLTVVIVEGLGVSAQAIVKEALHFGISTKSLGRECVVMRFSVLEISHCSMRTVLFASLIENIRTILTFPDELESHHLASTRNRGSFSDTPDSIARVGQSSLSGRVESGRKAESASLLPMVNSLLLLEPSLMVDAFLSAGIALYLVPRMSIRSSSSPGPMLAVFFQSIRPNWLVAR